MSNENTMEWRPVVGFPDYEVREDGEVKRVTANQRGRFKGIIMSQRTHPISGHMNLGLRTPDGVRRTCTIQNILAWAFHGAPPTPVHEAAHNDGNPKNNHYTNIRWATVKENSDDRWLHGTMCIGIYNKRAKLTDNDVIEIRESLKNIYHGIFKDLSRKYGVTDRMIHAIYRKRNWRHLCQDV